jgi:hypothetical protein
MLRVQRQPAGSVPVVRLQQQHNLRRDRQRPADESFGQTERRVRDNGKAPGALYGDILVHKVELGSPIHARLNVGTGQDMPVPLQSARQSAIAAGRLPDSPR